MIESILNSTKKILGLDFAYTAFDHDIVTHINSVFSILTQLGIGPVDGFMIEDEKDLWETYLVPSPQLNMVKTYMFLKVRMLFDPPSTSYLISAMERQISEQEWRLNVMRENLIPLPTTEPLPEEVA